MQRIMQITLSAFIAIMTMLTGFAVAPSALATPEVNYTDAPQLKHSDWNTCPNKHYMHVAEWTYCLNGNVKGAGDSGEWRWNDDEKTLTFDNFVLKRQNFTGSYGAGTFVEVVFDRSTVGMNELTVKYRGKNVIEQQSRGHSDAIALMFTMKSGGVDSKQDNPKVNLIGESADASLTITTDISDPDPNLSTTLESWGAPLTIGGQGTVNLNPGYSGTAKFAGAIGISAGEMKITDDARINITSHIANPQMVSTSFAVLGTFGSTVLAGNSQLNIDINGVTNGQTIGMYSRRDIAVTEQATLNATAKSPNMQPFGIRADGNAAFSSAKDTTLTAPGGRAIYARGTATFSGPGDVIASGNANVSMQADSVNIAEGYGVFEPESGSIANPGVKNSDGEKVGEWRLSMLTPRYELVNTSPAVEVESPVKSATYSQDATTVTYSAPETIEVNGKTWHIKIDRTNGTLDVTPAADALKGERADIPVTLTYSHASFDKPKERAALAPVVISEATAIAEPPTAQDINDVPEGSWQDAKIPSYDPDENGTPNPLNGVFTYDITYVNTDGEPFNPNDPITKGKKAIVTVSLTEKGKEYYTKIACPANAECTVNDSGSAVFIVDLKFKPKPESPEPTPENPSPENPTPANPTPAQPVPADKSEVNPPSSPKAPQTRNLSHTGLTSMALLAFGISAVLIGSCAIRRRYM